jgi:hypothetical protein
LHRELRAPPNFVLNGTRSEAATVAGESRPPRQISQCFQHNYQLGHTGLELWKSKTMDNLKNPSVMGMKIYKLLEADKILLLQDKSFPNIVSKIVGGKIVGSWWGHPLANPIYNGLGWLEHNRNVLVIKLLDGKVTYIHESLFSEIYSIVSETRNWQLKNLKPDDLKLFKYVSKKNKVPSDDPQLKNLVKDTKKSFAILENKLMLFCEEEHTESGKHIKIFMPWKKSKIHCKNPTHYDLARNTVEKVIADLNKRSASKAKLPWD